MQANSHRYVCPNDLRETTNATPSYVCFVYLKSFGRLSFVAHDNDVPFAGAVDAGG